MQVNVNSSNIDIFRVGVQWDIYNRKVTFSDMSTYNGSSGSGRYNVLGISFLLKDQQDVVLAEIDFDDASKFIVPGSESEFEVDLSQLSYPFLFQTYKIQAAIKDADGTIYYTPEVYKKICQPTNLNESGYVPGIFQVNPNCVDNVLTVKELTVLTYNNLTPASTTKTGVLYYPTGTINSVSFTGTPFSNNVIYTGQYRITCTTESEYDLGDDVSVLVTYLTNNVFDVTCANKIADLICCVYDLQNQYRKNCNNAIGQNAKQLLDEIQMPLVLGLMREINGQDASAEAAIIKKTLNCDCGATSLRQNEFNPINPSATNIVLVGKGGTTIPEPSVSGNTKTYNIASSVYQVVKGDSNDLGFSIAIDNSTTNNVKYKITLNYSYIAQYALQAIAANPNLITYLNSLITASGGVNLSGLDGKCVIDLTSINYFLSQNINTLTTVVSISTATNTYTAPSPILCSDIASVQSWLNGLGIGTFVVSGGSTSIGILSLSNSNNLIAVAFNTPSATVYFQKTNATLVGVLQAIIDYMCALTAAQVLLGATITLWQIDYNGVPVSSSWTDDEKQQAFNQGVASSIYNIVQYLATLTGITCTKIKAVYAESPTLSFGANARLHGADDDGNCVAWNNKQMALMVIAAINSYSDVKSEFCSIDCKAPATCPDVTRISVAMAGSSIGIYGVQWDVTPSASQSVTVQYKKNTSSTWLTATNDLIISPNGNVQNSPPYLIPNPEAGVTYDIKIFNNCGGIGFQSQIFVPTVSVYPGSYRIDNSLYLICGNTPVTLYTSVPFAPASVDVNNPIIYTDITLTTPLTGYSYIVSEDGVIYALNSSTGQLGGATGNDCDEGVSNVVLVGNNTGTICGMSIATGYTNGVFTPGGILYSDSGLTTPLTGYSYVVNTANNQIYNLNSVTGVIGSATGLSCTAYSSSFKRSNSEGTICTQVSETLYSSAVFGVGVTLYTDAALTTPATGYQYISYDATLDIYNMNSGSGQVGSLTGNNCIP